MKAQPRITQNDNGCDFWIFVLGVCYMSLGTFIDMLSTMIFGQNPIDTLLYLGVMCLLTVLSLMKKNFRIKTNMFYVPLVFALLFALDYILPEALPNKRQIMLNGFLQQGILGYFFARALTSLTETNKALKYVTIISFFSAASILLFPASVIGQYDTVSDNGAYMLFGFRMIPAAVLFQYFAFTEKTKFYRIFAVLSFIMLLIFANRGAVVAAGAFFVLYNLLYATGKKRIALVITSILLLSAYTILMDNNVAGRLYDWLISKGINSRNLQLLLNAQLGETGRDRIYEAAKVLIGEHVVFGTGLSGAWRVSNIGYPHNIIYELCIQFGLFPAALLILCFSVGSLKILKNKQSPKIGMLYLVFLVVGVVPLFFSASYISYWFFWVMLAMYKNCKDMIRIERGNYA